MEKNLAELYAKRRVRYTVIVLVLGGRVVVAFVLAVKVFVLVLIAWTNVPQMVDVGNN